MDHERAEDREQILNINFELNRNGEVHCKFGYSPHFMKHLKKDDVEREKFLSELMERLNVYIDGVE